MTIRRHQPVAALLLAPALLVPVPGGGAPPPHPGGPVPRASAAGGSEVAGRPADGTHHRWQWPTRPPHVLRPFRAPPSRWGAGHRGLDLVARVGSEVLAVEEGVVTHAGRVAGRGTVTVAHPGGLSSTYEPVRARVMVGAQVEAGAVVGELEPPDDAIAPGHCMMTPCLHLGARRDDGYLDPMLPLVGGRVRLLPLWPSQSSTG